MGLDSSKHGCLHSVVEGTTRVFSGIVSNIDLNNLASLAPLLSTLSVLTMLDGRFRYSPGEAVAQNEICFILPILISVIDRHVRLRQQLSVIATEVSKKFLLDNLLLFTFLGLSYASKSFLGSKFLAEHTHVSSSNMTRYELHSYDYYRLTAGLTVLLLSGMRHVYTSEYQRGKRLLAGIAKGLIETVGVLAANYGLHLLVTQFSMPRPRYFMPEASRPAAPNGEFQHINNLLPLESCNDSLKQNFFSDHASMAFIGAMSVVLLLQMKNYYRRDGEGPSYVLRALTFVSICLAATMASFRVAAACESPSSVYMGMLQGMFVTMLFKQVNDGLSQLAPFREREPSGVYHALL